MRKWETKFNDDGSQSLINVDMRNFEIDFDDDCFNLRYEGTLIMCSGQLRELLDAFESA